MTRSFSVLHVSVNIKNNFEKQTTLLLFFLSKSPSCWFWNVISFCYPLLVHRRAYGSYYKSIIAYILVNDDFYW